MRRLFLFLGCTLSASATTVQLEIPRDVPEAQVDYAIRMGKPAIEQYGHTLTVRHKRKVPLAEEAYEVITENRKIRIRVADGRGAMYSMLDLAEQLESGVNLDALQEGIQRPRIEHRAIQFNLPWAPGLTGDCFEKEQATSRDLDYWAAFLDMMVKNRFNSLALQSPCPGYSMVRIPDRAGLSPFPESELSEWQAFWTQLFVLAGERGIETYLVVEAASAGSGIEDVVRQTLRQYPGLSGLGLVAGMDMASSKAGDRMPDAVLKAARESGRPVRFLHLASEWGSGMTAGNSPGDNDPATREQHEPLIPRIHTGFYRLRWGHPDFVRSYVRKQGKSKTAGVVIGSAAILPLEDLWTREGFRRTWRWQFERHWLLYSVWGRLLYDPDTPDSTFERMLVERFPGCDGNKLLTAWKLASSIPQELSAFIKDASDTNYFMEPPGWKENGDWQIGFLDINELLFHPVADPAYINIRDFVRGAPAERQGKTTPFHLVKKLRDTAAALEVLLEELESGLPGGSALSVELADIEAWRYLGRYIAEKLNAGVAVESGRVRHSRIHLTKARAGLKRSISFWQDYAEASSRFSRESIACNGEETRSLMDWTLLVEKDVALSGEFYPAESSWEELFLKGEPHARHEAAFIECGGDLYLLGGRRIQPVDRLDLDSGEWHAMAEPPLELHHFQPVLFAGKLWVMGAMTGAYPDEIPVPNVYIFDPESDTWSIGPEIPADRRRGGAGAVYYGGSIYLVGGIRNGHRGGFVPWLDRLDPSTGKWEVLPDAPHSRDHFQAVAMGAKLYVAGGRRTSLDTDEVFSLTVPEVDAFDIIEGTWSTVSNLPTPRAGTSSLAVNGYLVVAGGEGDSQPSAFREVEAYNPETGVWVDWPSLIQGRHGTGLVLHDGRLYTASGCGRRGGSPELTTTEVLTVAE